MTARFTATQLERLSTFSADVGVVGVASVVVPALSQPDHLTLVVAVEGFVFTAVAVVISLVLARS